MSDVPVTNMTMELKDCRDRWVLDELHGCYMMEDILAGGNFGNKDPRRALSVQLFPDWEKTGEKDGKIKRIWNSLHKVVLLRYPKAKGKPVAIFFLMVYRAVRHLVYYCLGQRQKWSILAEVAEARESVYSRLRMFEKGDQD